MKILQWEDLGKHSFHQQFYQHLIEKFSPHINPQRADSWRRNLSFPVATQFLRKIHPNTTKVDLISIFQQSKYELKSKYLDLLQHAQTNPYLPECIEIPIQHSILEDAEYRRYFYEKQQQLLSKNKVVVVDSSCGSAVLAGAHVYAPGVWAIPFKIFQDEEVVVVTDV